MTPRGNATSRPPFRRLPLLTEPENLTFVVFREREQQSMNHFNLHAASKLKFLFFMLTRLNAKLYRNEWFIQTTKGKTGSSNFSSRLHRRSRPSCIRFHERALDMSFQIADEVRSLYLTSVSGIIVLLNTKHWIRIYRISFSTDSSFRPFWGKIFRDKIVIFHICTNCRM